MTLLCTPVKGVTLPLKTSHQGDPGPLKITIYFMAKTSLHLKACDIAASESHNKRDKHLDYVRPELSLLNESYSYIAHSLPTELVNIKREVKSKTGRKLQKNAVPLKEGVIVIDQDTTMAQIQTFCDQCLQRFGMRPLQIHIHRDEGHVRAKEWRPNLHAHIVWSMYDAEGRNVRLSRQDCIQMQTMLADCLQMERGKTSDKKYLDALQYKIQAEEGRLVELQEQGDVLEQNIREKSEIVSELGETLYNLEYSIRKDKQEQIVLCETRRIIKQEMFNATEELKKKKEEMVAEFNTSLKDYPQKGVLESNKTYLQRCEKFNADVRSKVLGVWGELDNPIKEFINLPSRVADTIDRGWRNKRNEKRNAFDNGVINQSYLDLRRMHPETFALLKQMNYQGLEDEEKSALLKGDAVWIKKRWHDPDDDHWSEECAAHVSVHQNELRFNGLSIGEFFRQVLSAIKHVARKISGDTKAQKQEIKRGYRR